ncbi:MAG: hypothetical protein V3U60_16155 [Gammaproteobacteria bacterium]
MSVDDIEVRVLLTRDHELELRAMLETAINGLGAEWLEKRNEKATNQGNPEKETGWTLLRRLAVLTNMMAGETFHDCVKEALVFMGEEKLFNESKVAVVPMSVLKKTYVLLKDSRKKQIKDGKFERGSATSEDQHEVIHLLAVVIVAIRE